MRNIVTKRLVMNNFTLKDSIDLFELIIDYSKSPMYKYDHKWPVSINEYDNIVKWFSSNDDYLAVRKLEDKTFIGFVNLTKENILNRYNLGFIFNSKYHNNGYAFEACRAYMDYLKILDENIEFITGTSIYNLPANKLLKKLNFKIIKECSCSFQKDDKNKPIMFKGYEYFYK